MSTPDARLSAAERAALADLEAAAAAADPSLAARLKGSSVWRAGPVLSKLKASSRRVWSTLLQGRLWGLPLTLVGLFFMALGLSTALVMSIIGAAMTAVGLRLMAEWIRSRVRARMSQPSSDG
jgi:hypothetical protein